MAPLLKRRDFLVLRQSNDHIRRVSGYYDAQGTASESGTPWDL
jgi:hypothetical protein